MTADVVTAEREEPVELPAIGIVGCGLMGSGIAALAQLAAGSSIGWDAVVQAARRYRLDDDPYFPHQADCGGEA